MAKLLMLAGLVFFLLGLLWYFVPGLFGWIGKLPGDIRIENENTRVFIPIVSMILISLVLSVLFNLFNR
jgi:hypothetical protein